MKPDMENHYVLPILSEQALRIWAKYDFDVETNLESWEPLALHLADTAQIAGLCYRYWLSESQRRLLRKSIFIASRNNYGAFVQSGNNADSQHQIKVVDTIDDAVLDTKIQKLVMFLAGIHDIGKATPVFASQVESLYRRIEKTGMPCAKNIQLQQRKSLPHGCAGQIILEEYLVRKGYQLEAATALGSVIGGHHGTSPSKEQVEPKLIDPVLLGAGKWEHIRAELIGYISQYVGWEEVEADFANIKWNKAQLALLQGVVIISDWISSNKNFFPLFSLDSTWPQKVLQNFNLHQERAMRAWQAVSLPQQWQPGNTNETASELLSSRFGFSLGVQARPLQEKAVELAKVIDLPGILILEDMMGAGKTEAALLAAEILAARSGASGVMVALPTEATTDAMFKRVLAWLPKMLNQSCGSKLQTISLMHGKSQLNQEYNELPDIHTETVGMLEFGTEFSDIGIDENEKEEQNKALAVKRHEWMMSAKKSLLSDFVVSTIDQVLMMALQSRYLTLRHLGISRKVVILDEIHSCDIYMGEYLKMALEWLGAYGIPVVALSATLAPDIRKELVEAYEKGANFKFEKKSVGRPGRNGRMEAESLIKAPNFENINEICYPVATVKVDNKYQLERIDPAFPSRKVFLDKGAWDDAVGIAQKLIADGGNLLIIHNTVKRAQETYRRLLSETDIDLRLVHARYIAIDRIKNDRDLLDIYGKNNDGNRPKCSIVVATQVVEQSLDIDFDAVITDLAPIDLIYQRIGRVHRHSENERPPSLTEAKCVVLGIPEVEENNLEEYDSIVKNIYPPLYLLKTASLFNRILDNNSYLELPGDMANQVAEVYKENTVINENWRKQLEKIEGDYLAEKDNQRTLAQQFRLGSLEDYPNMNLNDWLNFRSDLDERDGRAAVRMGEESLEVILVQKVECEDGVYWALLSHLPEMGGRILPRNSAPSWEETRMLMLSKVRLPYSFTDGERMKITISELEKDYCQAWQANKILAGELVLVLEDGSAELGGKKLRYTTEGGLEEVQNDR